MYMSPELINSRNGAKGYDGRHVDVWASGVLLIVMLLGAFPFDHIEHPDPNTSEAHLEVWCAGPSPKTVMPLLAKTHHELLIRRASFPFFIQPLSSQQQALRVCRQGLEDHCCLAERLLGTGCVTRLQQVRQPWSDVPHIRRAVEQARALGLDSASFALHRCHDSMSHMCTCIRYLHSRSNLSVVWAHAFDALSMHPGADLATTRPCGV